MRVKPYTFFAVFFGTFLLFSGILSVNVQNIRAEEDKLLETILQAEQKRQLQERKIEEKYIAESGKIFKKQIEILTEFRKTAISEGDLDKLLAADFFLKQAEDNLNALDMEITLKTSGVPDSVSASAIPENVFTLQKEAQLKIEKELLDETKKAFRESIETFNGLVKKLTEEEKIQDAVAVKALRDAIQKELDDFLKTPTRPAGWKNTVLAFPHEKAVEKEDLAQQRWALIEKLKEEFKTTIQTVFPCQDWTESGVISADGTLVLTGSNQSDAMARLFRVKDGKFLTDFSNDGAVMDTAFHPELPLLIAADTTPNIHLWNEATNEKHADFSPMPHCNVMRIAIHKKGEFAVAGSDKGRVFAWDCNNGKLLKEFANEHTAEVRDLVFHPNGKMFASAGVDGKVCFWNMENEKPTRVISSAARGDLFCIRFSPDGTKIAVTSKWNTPYTLLYDVKSGELSRNYGGYGKAIRSVNFSPDGRFLVTGDVDYNVVIWDIKTKEPLWASSRNAGNHIYRVQFTPDQKKLLIVAGFRPAMNQLPEKFALQEAVEVKANEDVKNEPEDDIDEDPFG